MIIRTDSILYRFLTDQHRALGFELIHGDYPPETTCKLRSRLIERSLMLMVKLIRMMFFYVAMGTMAIFIPLHLYWLSMGFDLTTTHSSSISELFVGMCVIIGSMVLGVCVAASICIGSLWVIIWLIRTVCDAPRIQEWYVKSKEKRCKPVVYEK